MSSSTPVLAAKYLAIDVGGSLALFPVWWYTRGLARTLRWGFGSIRNTAVSFGLNVWLKNLFVPMYGDTSWEGRLISFFVRLFMVAAFAVGTAVWSLLVLLICIGYLLVLPVAFAGFLFHLPALFRL